MIDFSKSVIFLTKECKEQHKRMKEKGFHDRDVPLTEIFGLIISEMCEAMDAERNGRTVENGKYTWVLAYKEDESFKSKFNQCIKDTVSDELADVFIRCMDAVGKYNKEGKEGNDVVLFKHRINERVNQMKDSPNTFAYYVYVLSSWSTLNEKTCCQNLMVMMEICAAIAIIHSIDLGKAIEAKIRYNETRGYKHGKKY
jgi:NTP pyrophosphatase (non-canonical NTP hydrolase)